MKTHKLQARISDNVLGAEHWTVVELTIEWGIVASQRTLHAGVYTIGLVGQTLVELADWSCYDGTDNHPYNSYELALPGDAFSGAWDETEIREAIR